MPAKEKKSKPVQSESVYINRELSWLAFNRRVLLEAADPNVPLLERLKFLMIYQSNLEEFFRVRIGILSHRALLTPDTPDPLTGLLPEVQINEVLRITREQQALMESIWKTIREELHANKIDVLDFRKISKIDELMSKKLFGDIRDMLFPKIISADQPLPFLWSGESHIVAFLGRSTEQKLCIIPLDRIPAYQSFEIDGCQKIVPTALLVRHFLPLLLKKENILQSAVVDVTRNADVFLTKDEIQADDDLRGKMSGMLSKRKKEMPVRARIYGKLTDPCRALLIKKLHVPESRVFTQNVPFDLSFRSCIGGPASFKYPDRKPARDIGLKKGEYFKYIEKHDLLMSFPFQSMLNFVDLIYEAADDPDVRSIRITLYRMSGSSKIAAALAYAADRGKDVLCLLELRARFDEQNNIDYSEMLEDAGCHVIYGLPDHKVHSKLCVITRVRNGVISRITQVGTGNYNEVTGEQYTDLSLITSREAAGLDAETAFEALAAGEIPPPAKELWIAPLTFKSRVLEMLDRELAKGEKGHVAIKVNALNSREVMEKLIECSQAGVKVELFIRGICSLRPGIPGLTENITVSGVIGRWLEHSRIYSFGDGADQRLFIGSGDMLNRNLERRVEAFVEAVTPDTREQLNVILDALRADREKAWEMQPDGVYLREEGGEGTSSQEALYRYFSTRKVSLQDSEVESPSESAKSESLKQEQEKAEQEKPVAEKNESEKEESDAPRWNIFNSWLHRRS
ncbi:MAG: polyphosphate kinase 1 [Clostridia bacterium]|nr:polyphosphate kinase 1 [Clostridia bacterium]